MAKQGRSVVGKDNFMRLHYLNQASELMSKTAANSNNPAFKNCAEFVSNYYSNLMINVAKKTVLRIDSDIKRNICKGCHSRMIPGENARVRIRKKPEKHVRWTCLKCYGCRVYNTKNDYKIWSERPEAVVEVLEFGDDSENEDRNKKKIK